MVAFIWHSSGLFVKKPDSFPQSFGRLIGGMVDGWIGRGGRLLSQNKQMNTLSFNTSTSRQPTHRLLHLYYQQQQQKQQ